MIRRPHLRLVVDNDNPHTVEQLWLAYSTANERRGKTRSEPDRIAARDCYNKWVVAHLGPDDAKDLIIPPGAAWGFN